MIYAHSYRCRDAVLSTCKSAVITGRAFFDPGAPESGHCRCRLCEHCADCTYEAHIVENLRVLCYSPPAPCLPYITSVSTPDAVVRKLRIGLEAVLHDQSLVQCRKALMLCGIRDVPLSEYERISEYEAEAIAMGYPNLQ